jgi:hypothetical protein
VATPLVFGFGLNVTNVIPSLHLFLRPVRLDHRYVVLAKMYAP